MTTERSQAPALEDFLCQGRLKYTRWCSCIFWLEFCEILLAEEYLKQNDFCLQHWRKSVSNFFGRAKHLKVSVIHFKRVRTFFFFSTMKKRWLDFTLEVFHIQLLKQMQNPSKIRCLDCSSLADFSEILKIIGEYIFCWKI